MKSEASPEDRGVNQYTPSKRDGAGKAKADAKK